MQTISSKNIFHKYLTPIVACNKVTIPDTKNSVEIMYPLAGSFSEIHINGHKMNGMDIVPPNIVKYCWNPNKIHMYHGGVSSIEYIRSLFVLESSFVSSPSVSLSIISNLSLFTN